MTNSALNSPSIAPDVPIGVTAVVCCYNSADRLPRTLAHLAALRVPDGVGFEVVVVDNASTDDTAVVARRLWPSDHPHPLRVLAELTPGLSSARVRGFAEARYPYVSFVDDDNLVCPEWVQVIAELATTRPEVGVIGSHGVPEFEVPPGEWLMDHVRYLAVGDQAPAAGDTTPTGLPFYGAGLTIRKSDWERLRAAGFEFRSTDRVGSALSSGGDYELCHALWLNGARFWYEPRLRFRHFMPAGRLSWPYLSRLIRGIRRSSILLIPYEAVVHPCRSRFHAWSRVNWVILVVAAVSRLARRPAGMWAYLFDPTEARHREIVPILCDIGRISGLLRVRGRLRTMANEIGRARWNTVRRTDRDTAHPPPGALCEGGESATGPPHSNNLERPGG